MLCYAIVMVVVVVMVMVSRSDSHYLTTMVFVAQQEKEFFLDHGRAEKQMKQGCFYTDGVAEGD
jgi:hypothetical protein